MDGLINYVKPELVVVSIVLYFIGIGIKNAEHIANKYIPLVLGGIGIFLAFMWVFATSDVTGYQSMLMAAFTAIVQGVLVAGLSTYVDQLIKQLNKKE